MKNKRKPVLVSQLHDKLVDKLSFHKQLFFLIVLTQGLTTLPEGNIEAYIVFQDDSISTIRSM